VAAWSTWQPYTAEAIVEYGASVIPTTGSEWNTNYIVASKSALANAGKSLAIGDYIGRLLKAANYARLHPFGWQAAYASATGLSAQLASLTAGSFQFSIAPLSPQVPNVPYRAALSSLLAAGMITSVPSDPEGVFDHRYDKTLRALEKSKAA
jgi:ABC-type nitrate/sulfonate/bicarbonate transport system substrate-binding protein